MGDPIQRNLKPLPPSPFSPPSPLFKPSVALVSVFDRIRFELDDGDKFAEFCWFARDYPRCYRHHLSCAAHRLKTIYQNYERAYARLQPEVSAATEHFISTGYEDADAHEIYWDFESFLSSVSSALDLLARIVGTAYKQHMPATFGKLCKRSDLDGPARRLRAAQSAWVSKMKEYRDCFTHYTPVDTLLCITTLQKPDGWHVWCKIPLNPQARDIIRFRSSHRTDVLRYALLTWRRMLGLDRTVANEISRLYRKKEFPKRVDNLFAVGRHDHSGASGETLS